MNFRVITDGTGHKRVIDADKKRTSICLHRRKLAHHPKERRSIICPTCEWETSQLEKEADRD